MDRASDSGSEGWGFESLPAYHIIKAPEIRLFAYFLVLFVILMPINYVFGFPQQPDKLVFVGLLRTPLAPLACEGGGPEGRGEYTAVR